jgi:hypothetical protein
VSWPVPAKEQERPGLASSCGSDGRRSRSAGARAQCRARGTQVEALELWAWIFELGVRDQGVEASCNELGGGRVNDNTVFNILV